MKTILYRISFFFYYLGFIWAGVRFNFHLMNYSLELNSWALYIFFNVLFFSIYFVFFKHAFNSLLVSFLILPFAFSSRILFLHFYNVNLHYKTVEIANNYFSENSIFNFFVKESITNDIYPFYELLAFFVSAVFFWYIYNVLIAFKMSPRKVEKGD